MRSKNVFRTNVNSANATVYNAETIHVRPAKTRRSSASYPTGCIGSDLVRRNYIQYLTERYNRFKQADSSFGTALKTLSRFSYAVIFKNIEAKFKAPTYFIPVERFNELVDYLQQRIDQTILGKRNLARGHRNYDTFDEYQLSQSTADNVS